MTRRSLSNAATVGISVSAAETTPAGEGTPTPRSTRRLIYSENNSATPALQKHGVTDDQMEGAGRSDVAGNLVVCVGSRRRTLDAIVDAIASIVDDLAHELVLHQGRLAL